MFVKRLRFRRQRLKNPRPIRPMNRLGQRDRRLGRRFAVIARQRDIAGAVVKLRHPFDVSRAAFLLLALQLLRRLAQRGAGEAGLALVHLALRLDQGDINNVAEIGLRDPAGDFLFVNFDRVAHRLFLALQIEVAVAGDFCRHLVNEAQRHVALARRLFGVVLDQQIENRGVGDVLR